MTWTGHRGKGHGLYRLQRKTTTGLGLALGGGDTDSLGCEVSRTDLREITGTHRPTAQILTAERSLSGASSDLSNDLEKEGGQERGKETSLSGTLTLSWCDG